MEKLRHILRHWVGLDRPISYIICGQAWGFISGPITIYLILRFFSAELQGFYYTFSGVMALQFFLQMGFAQCIMQYASHEFAHLQFGKGGRLTGDPAAKSRFVSLGRLAVKWYCVLAVLLVVGIGTGGQVFFSLKSSTREWLWPWWLLCAASGANLALLPFFAILQGCNQVSFVSGYRTVIAVFQSCALWVALILGAKLYCASVTGFIAVGAGIVILATKWRGLVGELMRPPQHQTISWRKEVWPYQWRIAVSAMSGYFVNYLFTPVLFQFEGPVAAGKMGMTLQLVNAVQSAALSWTATKAPHYGILISQGRHEELDRLARKSMQQAFFVCLLGGVLLLVSFAWVKMHFAIGARIADLTSLSVLVVAACANQLINGQAYYLRAFKEEPFLGLSIIGAVLTAVGVVIGAKYYGILGAAVGYALATLTGLPWATWIYRRKRQLWRAHFAAHAGVPAENGPVIYPSHTQE